MYTFLLWGIPYLQFFPLLHLPVTCPQISKLGKCLKMHMVETVTKVNIHSKRICTFFFFFLKSIHGCQLPTHSLPKRQCLQVKKPSYKHWLAKISQSFPLPNDGPLESFDRKFQYAWVTHTLLQFSNPSNHIYSHKMQTVRPHYHSQNLGTVIPIQIIKEAKTI